MNSTKLPCQVFCAVLLACCLAPLASAAVIDFETTPAGPLPTDNLVLNTPFAITGGGNVQFYFDVNGNNSYDAGLDDDPIFERIGQDGSDAYTSSVSGSADTAAPGFAPQLGFYFLRHPMPFSLPPSFVIDYNTAQTITGLSGEIWDIDGTPTNTERWLVEVLDGPGSVLASQLSPLGNSTALDSLPWTFGFSGLPAGVDKVRLTFAGTKTTGIGLAFNNFSPTVAVPEPGVMLLAGCGGVGLVMFLKKKKCS